MAIRAYHLARELDMLGSEFLKLLKERGMDLGSVVAVLDDDMTEKARRVALGEIKIERPTPGRATEPRLPPPIVPAPPRSARPPGAARPGAAPGRRRAPEPRPAQPPRKGIRIFRQKETRERRVDSQRGEEAFAARTLAITVPISLRDFSQQIGVKTNDLLVHLMKQNIRVGINALLDEETVLIMAEAFNRTITVQRKQTMEEELQSITTEAEEEEVEGGETRPPVVTVLGHVDHGKTSLLDHIRKSRVAAGEAGGITQHIGAYRVPVDDKRSITFLDTPGHEAFTAMRARGAKVTDLVVLVVAADDGVMPQTEEALSHARAASVPIVVALNKCDKREANPEKVKQQLASLNLVPEEWGGNTAMMAVSALTGAGVQELLDRMLLEAEVLDLRADPTRNAEGYVVEAHKHPGKGVVATMLVKNGTLRRGDMILAGSSQGKVKSLHDEHGRRLKSAPPSTPVEVTGLDEVPEAGWRFQVVDDSEIARRVASERAQRQREEELAARSHVSFEKLLDRIESQDALELRIVLKADVKGSVEALRGKIDEFAEGEVKVKVLHAGVGAVTESDILLAAASRGIVLGFNVAADAKARAAAEQSGVEIRTYQIIYELLEDLRRVAEGLLPSEVKEVVIGHAQVRQVISVRRTKIAGCMVTDGVARRNAKIRLVRGGIVVLDGGALESLKRFKDDAREVKDGLECGCKLQNFDDIKEGDVIEFYTIEELRRTL